MTGQKKCPIWGKILPKINEKEAGDGPFFFKKIEFHDWAEKMPHLGKINPPSFRYRPFVQGKYQCMGDVLFDWFGFDQTSKFDLILISKATKSKQNKQEVSRSVMLTLMICGALFGCMIGPFSFKQINGSSELRPHNFRHHFSLKI